MLALHVLQNHMVSINTLMLQQIQERSHIQSAATMGNIGLQSEISPCERDRGVEVIFGGVWLFA
jgi:hypothetical protein